MRVISALTTAGYLWFLYRMIESHQNYEAHHLTVHIAISCFGFSLALFWWTVKTTRQQRLTIAFTPDLPIFIHTKGPYALVRHPFYLSYLIFWIGTALCGKGIFPWTMPIVMAGLYIAAARAEEQKFAISSLNETYKAYREQTGMILPKLKSIRLCLPWID
jgi:protein-S-isoprenylcysteine O-methyltransferase Ste14